ncbi:HD-like signal output (HDOD) protein [Nitrospina gracilis]|uniref:HDOD domain-containing protein n=1 Tax=Nitrospina TaxID=35800 RepID=UPI000349E159|nr:HDOD domain-containing protein [Nitrospina gracilis]MCF8723490.1 HD-like signal output (HDOD) protein [Nitrospina sp. Nb-3]
MSATLLDAYKCLPGLPSHPEQIAKVIDVLGKTSSADYDLLHLIQYDPAIAARILAVANLPVYGYERRVESLQQAAGLLSPSLVTSVILTTPVFEMFRDADHTYHRKFDHLQLWAHGAVTGTLAALLANKLGTMEEDVCLTLGLLHDLGKMALIINHPREVLEALDRARKDALPFPQALQDVAGCTPQEVAGQLAEEWHYPANLIEYIQSLENGKVARETGPVVIVRLANRLAEDWGYGDGLHLPENEPLDPLVAALGISLSDLSQWKPDMQSRAENRARRILSKTLS